MQAITPAPAPPPNGRFGRNLAYFLAAPLTAVVLITLLVAYTITSYQSQHRERIYTGISVWGVDLSQMRPAEAEATLATAFPYAQQQAITLTDPTTGQQWSFSPSELGLSYDFATAVGSAYQIGRTDTQNANWQTIFDSWYYGRSLNPALTIDESQLDATLTTVAAAIQQPAANAAVNFVAETAVYTPAQAGRTLDLAQIRPHLLTALTSLRPAQIELPIVTLEPTLYDDTANVTQMQQAFNSGDISFYLQNPLDELDLAAVTLPANELARWLRVEVVPQANGSNQHNVFLDENAARQWLTAYADSLYREPVNARYYFDDAIEELVLVSPHVNGRQLDIEATLNLLQAQIDTPNRSLPFVVNDIMPTVHSNATAADLGITELISERTTWFRGSSDARKTNIARSAANFYGIVIAPGEEFSFNKYLGSISEDDGYEEGLIIYGGQTIKGIGGGVCQVSTTVFQTVFWAGFPVTERWQHGYMLSYYNDGEGPGLDATVYSPIVDFKFVNNTPYHLLIENYYNESEESLTFKFYSTSMGRRVEKAEPIFENIIPAPPADADVWQFDEDLTPGTVRQIDWATEGATVTVGRTVYNAEGQVMLDEQFVSNYIPWPNGYMYGPNVDAPDYSLVP